jgi:hypothetical protein
MVGVTFLLGVLVLFNLIRLSEYARDSTAQRSMPTDKQSFTRSSLAVTAIFLGSALDNDGVHKKSVAIWLASVSLLALLLGGTVCLLA